MSINEGVSSCFNCTIETPGLIVKIDSTTNTVPGGMMRSSSFGNAEYRRTFLALLAAMLKIVFFLLFKYVSMTSILPVTEVTDHHTTIFPFLNVEPRSRSTPR